MKRTSILASAGAVALGLSLVVCVVSAGAQHGSNAKSVGVKVDRDNLPQVTPYRSPLQVDIVDDGPIIKDRRRRAVNQQYQIQIEPLAPEESQTTVFRVPGSSGNGGTARGGAPGTITLDPLQPPPATFGTNIPAGGPRGAANPLQDGTTTNRLGSQANARGKMNAPTITVRKGDLLRSTTKPSATPTMTYKETENNFATGSFASQKNVKVNVKGTLKSPVKRGEYLKPPQ